MSEKFEILRPFGPPIAKFKIPLRLVKKINNFVDEIIKDKNKSLSLDVGSKLSGQVSQEIALPKEIYYISELPKTRSGKILRRLLRSILINPYSKNYGDLSTMLNMWF